MINRTEMTSTRYETCPCANAAPVRKSPRRRVGEFVLILALAAIVVLCETWAIVHAPLLPEAVVHVFSDGRGGRVVPIANIH
jgi:hypothetical protein